MTPTDADEVRDVVRHERRALYEAIQMQCAGHRVDDVLHALGDAISLAVGFLARDIAQADFLIDSLPADLKRTVRDNWVYLQETKALSGGVTEQSQ
jgi:hypothetical protein